MDGDNIKTLLDKFYGGTATEAEEQALAELLESGAWPQGMEADCRAASALLCARCPAMPPGLGQAIGRSIDKLATQQRPRRRWPAVACAAAVAALLAAGGLWQWGERRETQREAELAECRRACMETEQALTLFSTVLNDGLAEVGRTRIGMTDCKQNQ